jgi:hypothetical protein
MSVNLNEPGTSSELPSIRDFMKARGRTWPPRFAPRSLTFVTQAAPGPRKLTLTRGFAPRVLPSLSLMVSVV